MDPQLASSARRLLSLAGVSPNARFTALPGGRNNRAYRVDVAGGPLFLKAYFRHPLDAHDRLSAEFAFSVYAHEAGVGCVAKPLAADKMSSLGLYEFIPGQRMVVEDVSGERIDQAARFFDSVNAVRHSPSAAGLGRAVEAGFALSEHLRVIEQRVLRLQTAAESGSERSFGAFVRDHLVPCSREVFGAFRRRAGSRLEESLPRQERCVSPSDFGFHNALVDRDDNLWFVDFEYAGWDEPAKMVCDFFNQVQVPVPDRYLQPFVETALAGFADPSLHLERIEWLMPLYRVKWCCILLNEFLPVAGARRTFAAPNEAAELRNMKQLAKARGVLERLMQPSAA